MATVLWRGLQGVTRKVYRWTCNASAGDVYTLTHNLKTISYTAGGSDTATDVATGLVAAAQASPEPEWQEVDAASSGAVVTITGPDDGATLTVTASVSGGATLTAGTTTSPVSPHDVGDAVNYSTGSLPANNDTLVIPVGSADMRYNVEALNAITGLTIIREAGGPAIGLPDYRATGYREYRPTRLKLPATTVTIRTTNQDSAGSIRLNLSAATSAVTITGDGGNTTVGSEVVDIIGTASTSSISCNSSSVVVAPAISDTATLASITADNSTVTIGRGVTLTTAELNGCQSLVSANWTTLTVNGTGTTTIVNAATGSLVANGGTVNWNGTGTLTNPVIGPGVTLDLSAGSGAVAVSGAILRYDGSVINDPGTRITVPYEVDCVRTDLTGLNLGRHRKLTVDTL